MKIINFTTPPSSRKKATHWWAKIFLVFAAILSATAIRLHLKARKLLDKRLKAHGAVAVQAQKVQNLEQELAQLKVEKKQFQQDIDHAKKKIAASEQPMQLLEQLATIMPAELHLKRITLGHTIQIEGVGKTKHQKKIQQFVARCLDQEWCPYAELDISPGPDEHQLAFTIIINKSKQGIHGRYKAITR